jgi:FdhE protein
MNATADAAKKLKDIIDAAIDNYPHSRDIIEAFRPVIMEKARLVEDLASRADMPLTFDENRFKEGVPFNAQNDLFLKDDPWDKIALALIPAMVKGFPDLAADLEKVRNLVKDGTLDIRAYVTSTQEKSDALMRKWVADHGISEQAAGFVAHLVARVLLERRARDWSGLIKDFPWDKGYCPICGAPPMMAKIAEDKGTRWLLCSRCSHEWNFSRVICPCCDNKDQKAMDYFFIEGREQESTFVCKQCNSYLITLSKVSELAAFHGEVSALSLVHLDVLMQEKGYEPMAATEWNSLT